MLALLLMLATPAYAVPPGLAVVGGLPGCWRVSGRVRGKASPSIARGAWHLGWRYFTLHLRATGPDPYEAAITYGAGERPRAVEGVRDLFRYEHNAWIHLGAAAIVATLGMLLRVTLTDWRWLILSIALVWAAEAGNTAVEQVCELVHPGRHPIVKRVKDLAAGGVLICALAAMLIGAATLVPYLDHFAPLLDTVH